MSPQPVQSAIVRKVERGRRPHRARASCPHCGQSELQPRHWLPDFDVVIGHCTQCGLGRLDPPLPPQTLAEYYTAELDAERTDPDTALSQPVQMTEERLQACRFLTRRLQPGSRVLDVDCGHCALLKSLAPLGFDTYEIAVHQPAPQELDARIQLAIAESLAAAGFRDSFFDAVVLWNTLPRLSDPVETLTEIRRILKPGGYVAISVPNYSSLQSRLFGADWFQLDPPRDQFFFPIRVLKRMLKNAGLRCITTRHLWPREDVLGWRQSFANARGKRERCARYEHWLRYTAGRRGHSGDTPSAWSSPLTGVLSLLTATVRQGSMVRLLADLPLKTADATIPATEPQTVRAVRKGVAYEFPQTQPHPSHVQCTR